MNDRVTANLPSADFDRTEKFYAALGLASVWKDAGWIILRGGGLEITRTRAAADLLVFNAYGHLFACGLALYLLRERGFEPLWAAVVAAAPIIQYLHDGAAGFFAVGLAAALMTAATQWRGALPGFAAPLIWLSSISYGLYLTHQMIGYTLLAGIERAGAGAGLTIALTIVAAVSIAAVLTYGVEKPAARALKKRLGGRARPALSDVRT